MIYDLSAYNVYIRKPYLAKAAESQLSHRHDAIRANLWTAPPPGKPQLHNDPNKASFWAAKITEVRTEQFLRSARAGLYRGTPQDFISFNAARLLSSAVLEPNIVDAVRTLALPPSPFLVRFTDACYVQDALQHGRFRIAPAAVYDDPSLNAAQRDDELSHASIRGDRHIVGGIIGYLPGEDPSQARPMPVQWGQMFEYMNSANFYVLCLTNQFDARMFKDFGKDAAIIIHNPAAFIDRLASATETSFPELQFKAEPVRYYDPYTVERNELVPGYSKNFSFAYQSEFRPTWWPRDPAAKLSPFFVEIGDMTDIAEAVYL
jgi:hypothetical protein